MTLTKEQYALQMNAAAADPEFVRRTTDSQQNFDKSDADTEMLASAEDCN